MRASLLIGPLALVVACATTTDSADNEWTGGWAEETGEETGGDTGGSSNPGSGGTTVGSGGISFGSGGTGEGSGGMTSSGGSTPTGGASSGGDTSTGGETSTGGSTSTGGETSTGGSFGGDCEGYPAYEDWTPASGNFAVATCAGGTPCCEMPGCNSYSDPTVSGTYLFECTDSHKPNCQGQDPGTTNWANPPWTRVAECE